MTPADYPYALCRHGDHFVEAGQRPKENPDHV